MNKSELPRLPTHFVMPAAGWSYPELKDKYLALCDAYRMMMNMQHSAVESSALWEKYAINLKTDLDNAMECYQKCYQAHRKTDGEYIEPTFDQLNVPVIHTGRIIDAEVE